MNAIHTTIKGGADAIARIQAKADNGKEITTPYSTLKRKAKELYGNDDSYHVHRAAAMELVKNMGYSGNLWSQGDWDNGYAFVMLQTESNNFRTQIHAKLEMAFNNTSEGEHFLVEFIRLLDLK